MASRGWRDVRAFLVHVGCALSATPFCHVESAASEEGPTARDATGPSIAEVIVTARKRPEAARDVPVSLSVRSGEQLERALVQRVQEIAPTVPNLAVSVLSPRQASVAIRGIGRNPANDGLEGSVGVFLDGVYLARPGMAVADFIDLERIEVLRGPQGTFFGKNATAGVLSFETRSPTDAFEAYAQASLGNASFQQLHGAVSGPLTDDWSARLTALMTRRDGFVSSSRGDLGEFNRNAVRAQLAWRPSESFDLRLTADYSDQDEDGAGVVLVHSGVTMEDGSTRPNSFLDRTARAGYTPEFEPFARRNTGDAEQRVRSEQGGFAVHARWGLGDHTLTSITAWRMWNSRPRSDGDHTPLDIQPELHFEVSDEQVTSELRLASPDEGVFDYQVGLFVFGQNLRSDFVIRYGEHAADFAQAGLPARALDGFGVRTRGHPRTRSAAVFSHLNWDLTPRLALSGGLRWTTEEKQASIQRTHSGGAPLLPTDDAARSFRERLGSRAVIAPEIDEDFTSGSVSLSWRFAPQTLTYLSVSRGAKSGGVNVAIPPSGIDQTLDPEVATSFEVGLKQSWLNAVLELTAFDMRIDDYQATVRDPFRAATFLANAGEVRTRGVELEGAWTPAANLQLNLAAGFAQAEFESFRQAACPPETVGRTACDLSGERVPGAPPWTVALSAAYEFPFGSANEAFVEGEWFHAARYQMELSRYTTIRSYDVLNARIGVRNRSARCEAWLWIRNALDEDYYALLSAGGAFNSGVVYGLTADPRTYGLSVRLNY